MIKRHPIRIVLIAIYYGYLFSLIGPFITEPFGGEFDISELVIAYIWLPLILLIVLPFVIFTVIDAVISLATAPKDDTGSTTEYKK